MGDSQSKVTQTAASSAVVTTVPDVQLAAQLRPGHVPEACDPNPIKDHACCSGIDCCDTSPNYFYDWNVNNPACDGVILASKSCCPEPFGNLSAELSPDLDFGEPLSPVKKLNTGVSDSISKASETIDDGDEE